MNSDRRGAVHDPRSNLFIHVARIRQLLQEAFPWCPVHSLMESVASMDSQDRTIMSKGFGCEPIRCDAGHFTWCHRPRLYWLTWEVVCQEPSWMQLQSNGELQDPVLVGSQPLARVLRPGWIKIQPDVSFPTFTAARPQARPGRKPAGLKQCGEEDLRRWQQDLHRFPPYQYREEHCVVNKHNLLRVPDVEERELMLGFPLRYTASCAPKGASLCSTMTRGCLCWATPGACQSLPGFWVNSSASWVLSERLLPRRSWML